MYERFTDRARKVMQLANQEAQRFNHEYIGTEHILLGLVKEGEGAASIALMNLGVDLGLIRREVEKLVHPNPDMVTMGKLPRTPRATRAINAAMQAAIDNKDNYVGTEHLLIGLIRESGGVAFQVLKNLGVDEQCFRRSLDDVLSPSAPRAPEAPAKPETPNMHPTSQKFCAILDEIKSMHLNKSADYGLETDPLHNLRRSSSFGVEPWRATLVRLGDKVTRAEAFAKKGTLRNEGFEDTLLDLSAYAILVLILFRETLQPDSGDGDSDPDGGTDDIGTAYIERRVLDPNFGD